MTGQEALFIAMGAAAAGFINGMAAFGTALFALGFFLTVMPPVQAVALSVTMATINGLQGSWLVRREIAAQKLRLARFVLPGLVGVPLGVSLLQQINVDVLKLTIAAFLILYGGYFSLRRQLPEIGHRTPFIDGLIGFLGGVLGGAAALSGALPTMWCSLRSWPRRELRAVLQPFNVVILSSTLALLILNGAFTRQTLIFLALALPVAVVFAKLGHAVFNRLPDQVFRRLLIGLCLVSGTALLLRELI
ncbi:sulfite exporter TauE/SafE family protein [uncultured Roseobacter sp.]|uniref:sulfite exporter TauE/SafE family protein n=1 Tax=uncultured Roseobacter sp. TaxID=114847 RepID=UPI0026215A50|nr:sulfite exporter TauE/SafE family protein [uncultured Roseobacter sp.]